MYDSDLLNAEFPLNLLYSTMIFLVRLKYLFNFHIYITLLSLYYIKFVL